MKTAISLSAENLIGKLIGVLNLSAPSFVTFNISRAKRSLWLFAMLLAVMLGFIRQGYGQGTQLFTTPGTFSFTVPAGVTSLTAECWGAGGGGGGDYGGGGGGGAYSILSNITVTPGTIFTNLIHVGAGGKGNKSSGDNGDFSSASFGDNYRAIAYEGHGGIGFGPGGIGGNGTYRGGSGASGASGSYGGGGGSSAGTGSDGITATSSTGAAAVPGGGAGGSGGNNGSDGSFPGGGGGGGVSVWGNGADGQVRISWSCPSSAGTLSGEEIICLDQTTTFTSDVLGGTWSSGNTAVANINSSTGVITAVSAGTATMTYTVASSGCPTRTVTRTVTVKAPQVVAFNGNTICNGGTGQFTITTSSGTGPFSVIINGVTYYDVTSGTPFDASPNPTGTTSYTISSVTDADGCVRTSSFTDGAATITVNQAPNITFQPASPSAVCTGTNSSNIIVEASGAGLTYQWQRGISGAYTTITGSATPNDGAVYSGYTTAVLTVTNALLGMNGYTYRCVVEGTCPPAVTSDGTAVLTVNTLPVPPSGATGAVRCGTGTVTISVSDPGVGFTIDWYANPFGGPVLSGGSGILNFITPSISSTTTYYAQTRNTASGCVSSTRTEVIATVNTTPTVGTINGPSSVCPGSTAVSYFVGAVDNALSYIWAYSGTGATIHGTTNSVTIDFASNATAGNLTVKGHNDCGDGTVSADFPITFISGPTVTGGTICLGAVSSPLTAQCTYGILGMIDWYTQSSGGTIVQSAYSFNPVGDAQVIAQGGIYASLANTGTPGTYTFYADCQSSPGCRTAVDFIILPSAEPDVTGFSISNASSPVLSGSPATLTLNSPNLIDGTYTVSYNLTGANTATNATASVNISSHNGNFNTSNLSNTGSTTITITSIKNASDCSSAVTGNNSKVIVVGPSTSTTNYSSGFFYVPEGIFSITVEAWGGGGSGGGNSNWYDLGAGGGGGGAYASSILTVVPGDIYDLNVGAGSSSPLAGGTSSFSRSASTLVAAVGGNSCPNNVHYGEQGGAAADCTGDVKYSGGRGANGTPDGGSDISNNFGGGGGSSAGTGNNGTNGIGWNGGVAPIGGGNGGNGQNGGTGFTGVGGDGNPGSTPGGGGGGAYRSNSGMYQGGAGADGKVIISWLCPTAVISYSSSYFYPSDPTAPVSLVGSAGGTFNADPSGLSINVSTGEINPSASTSGIYTVHYQIPAAGSCAAVDATFTITVVSPPVITVGSVSDFGDQCTNTPSAEKSYTVSGSDLTADIVITPPPGFEISKTSGSGFANTAVTLTQTGGNVASTPIYVRFSPTITGGASGNITHTSTGATTKNVAVTGVGKDRPSTATNPNPANGASGVSYTGLDAVSSVSWNAVSGATSYDVYFGAGSLPGSPTANVVGTNSYSTGALSASTTYRWKVVPKNECGETTGTPAEWTFTTMEEVPTSVSATWPLTSNGNASTSGSVTATPLAKGSGITSNVYYDSSWGAYSLGWDSGSRDLTDYYEFTISPATGYDLTVTGTSFYSWRYNSYMVGNGAVYYSLDGFSSGSTQLGSNFSLPTTGWGSWSNSQSITVNDGQTLSIRVYAWGLNSWSEFHVKDFVISGTTETASPTLSVDPVSFNFGEVCLSSSSNLTFKLTGSGLTGDVSINAPAGFSVLPTSVSPTNGRIDETITLTFSPAAVQTYSGNVTVSGGGASSVNVAVTGDGKGVPSTAINPNPGNGASGVSYTGLDAVSSVSWNAVSGATSYDVYFGAGSLPESLIATVGTNSYSTGALSASTTYRWKVVPKNECGETTGTPSEWTFTTMEEVPASASATWPLTSNGNASTSGNVTATPLAKGTGVGIVYYDSGFGAYTGGWNSGSLDLNDYFEFTISPATGYDLTVTGTSFYCWEYDLNNNNGTGAVYYSLDGFSSGSTQLGSNFSLPRTNFGYWGNSQSITVNDGQTLSIRVYSWGHTGVFHVKNFVISGTTETASPTLSVDPVSLNFGEVCLSSSSNLTFNLTGSGLTGDVSINAPAGFSVLPTSVSPTNGRIDETITLTFSPAAVQTYSGNVTVSGGGASSVNVAVTGDGKDVPSTAINPNPGNGASGVSYTGLDAVSSVSWDAVSGATSYDVYFGAGSMPVSPTATVVGTNSYSTGALSVSTTYRWKVVPKNECGVTTGTPSEWTFTTNGCTPPTPTFTASPTSPQCPGDAVTYTSQAGKTNYVWNIPGTQHTDYEISSGGTSLDNTVALTWLSAGSKTVTVNYTEVCQGVTPASSTITVNAPPVVSITGETTIFAGETTTLSPVTGGAWTSSNTAKATVSTEGVVTGVSAGTATFTFTDVTTGCSATTEEVTMLGENVSPEAKCQDVIVYLDDAGNGSTTAQLVDNGSYDESGIKSLELSKTDFTCADIATNPNVVTLTVTDNNGNVSTCEATVTVIDNIPPVAVCKDITVQLDETGHASIVVDDVDGGSSDNCGIATREIDLHAFTCENVGNNNTVVLTVTDNNGNQSTCEATVTVEDNLPPVAVCQDIVVNLDATGNVTIFADEVDGGSSDACGIATREIGKSTFTCDDLGPNTVILTMTDKNGLKSTCQATVTVVDKTPPSITIPASNETVECDGLGNIADYQAWLDNHAGAVASDACSGEVTWSYEEVVEDVEEGAWIYDCASGKAKHISVIFYAIDASNNKSVGTTAVFKIEDTIPPTITTEAVNLTVSCTPWAYVTRNSWLSLHGSAEATDGCSNVTWHNNFNEERMSDGCGNTGSEIVTFTAVDACGNSITTQATFTIEDNTPPYVETLVSNSSTVNCAASATVPATLPVVNDFCSGTLSPDDDSPDPVYLVWSDFEEDFVPVNAEDFCEGLVEYTFNYADECGNPFAWTYTYNVDIPAFADIPATEATVECYADFNPDLFEPPTVYDNCGKLITNITRLTEEVQLKGAIIDICAADVIYTWTYTDCAGNSKNYVHTVHIVKTDFADNMPDDDGTVVECADKIAGLVPTPPTVYDNCGTEIIPSGPAISDIPDCEGDVTYKWTYTDCTGNFSHVWTYTFTIDRTTPPDVLDLEIENGNTAECLSDVIPPWEIPKAMDVCGNLLTGKLTSTVDYVGGETGTITCEGTRIYTYTYTDCSGLTSTWTFTSLIKRTTAPSEDGTPVANSATVECLNMTSAPANLPVVKDVCGKILDPVGDIAVGSFVDGCEGTKTFTYTYFDCANLPFTWTFTYTVDDTQPPTASNPLPINVECSSEIPAPDISVVTDEADACGGTPVVAWVGDNMLKNGGCDGYEHTITRTYSVTDCAGNSIEVYQTINIKDVTPPTITCKAATVTLDAGGNASIDLAEVLQSASDNCFGDLTIDFEPKTFTCENVGANVVTVTAKDCAGNINSCTAVVTVQDLIQPDITCVSNTTKNIDPSQTYYTVVGTEFDATADDACGIKSLMYACTTASVTTGTSLAGIKLLGVKDHIIVWTAVDENDNESTCTTIVTVTKRGTKLTYTGDLTEQYSDETNLRATLADDEGNPVQGKTITFTVGIESVSAETDEDGIATAVLKLTQSPIPVYNVVASFAGDDSYESSEDTDPFDITQEGACVNLIGQVFFNTSGTTVNTADFSFTWAVSQDDDGNSGDLNTSTIQMGIPFITADGGKATIAGTPVFNSANSSFTATLHVEITNNSPGSAMNFTLHWDITGGYYANKCDEETVISVAIPGNDFSAGGGYLILGANSGGSKKGLVGTKNNFGYNIKWGKNFSKPSGNVNIIWRTADGLTFQARSNTASALIISKIDSDPDRYMARITYTNVNMRQLDCLTNCWADGNGTVILTVKDWGEPGSQTVKDQIGITVKDKRGNLIFSSNTYKAANQDPTLVQDLAVGNIQVKSSALKAVELNNEQTVSQDITPVASKVKVYPNPFSDRLYFEFVSPVSVNARIDIYDNTGRMVQTLFNRQVAAGVINKAEFTPGTNVSGLYIYRLIMGDEVFNGKVVYRK